MNSPTQPVVRPLLIVAAFGVPFIALTGCSHRPIVVQTPAPTVIQQAPATPAVVEAPAPATPPPVVVVNSPPPAPRPETATPQPSAQHVWIPGYWAWRNNHQEWTEGHWEIPPRPSATWVAPRWDRQGSDYVFIDGYWQ